MDFAGYAIGGLSVGETPAEMYAALDVTTPHLPRDRPRYLMGVGRPIDLLEAIARGVDLFDCVMPTRNGRNALAFTDRGPVRLRNQQYALDREPLEADCPCPACRHSRGYLRHLFQANEMLGPMLLSIHNLTYYQRLMAGPRGRSPPTALRPSARSENEAGRWTIETDGLGLRTADCAPNPRSESDIRNASRHALARCGASPYDDGQCCQAMARCGRSVGPFLFVGQPLECLSVSCFITLSRCSITVCCWPRMRRRQPAIRMPS